MVNLKMYKSAKTLILTSFGYKRVKNSQLQYSTSQKREVFIE